MSKNSITSYNIFGITGGIGFEFYKLIRNKKIQASGYYYSNDELAKEINIRTHKIDLAYPQNINYSLLDNFEGLLYVAGEPFFSNKVFQIDNQDIINQININITSLLIIINSLLNKKETKLKKIVIVSSKLPQNKSIYHLSKYLQETLFNFVANELNYQNVSVSIIRTGWVNTKMLTQYIKKTNDIPSVYHSASFIAEECFKEFFNESPFNIIEL